MAGDYDVDVADWLRGGTPMGIEEAMIPRGVFPEIDEATPAELRRPIDVWHEGFINYTSLEAEPEGAKALHELVASGFVKEFSSYRDVKRFLRGRDPVSSKLAVVKNESDGIIKYRLILYCRVSGSNDAAERRERVLLPKAWDIIRDIMALRKNCKSHEEVFLFLLDFKDAFYMLPLLDEEYRYFTAFHDGKWYVWRG